MAAEAEMTGGCRVQRNSENCDAGGAKCGLGLSPPTPCRALAAPCAARCRRRSSVLKYSPALAAWSFAALRRGLEREASAALSTTPADNHGDSPGAQIARNDAPPPL